MRALAAAHRGRVAACAAESCSRCFAAVAAQHMAASCEPLPQVIGVDAQLAPEPHNWQHTFPSELVRPGHAYVEHGCDFSNPDQLCHAISRRSQTASNHDDEAHTWIERNKEGTAKARGPHTFPYGPRLVLRLRSYSSPWPAAGRPLSQLNRELRRSSTNFATDISPAATVLSRDCAHGKSVDLVDNQRPQPPH